MRKEISIIKGSPSLLLAIPLSLMSLLLIFILRPFIHIRIGFFRCDRIGHFAGNTELYLCEKDYQGNRSVDLFYLPRKPCNLQLLSMWERELTVLPWFFLRPMDLIIRSFDFLSSFHAANARGGDRDIDSYYEKYSPHLHFTAEEKMYGESKLREMGVPEGSPIVCITVRDDAYLKEIYSLDKDYMDFRNCDVQNYVLVAEELAERGYYVFRMGAKVNSPMKSSHPKVIDYASNGMRSDFMDIYLGSKCAFCITNGTGYDAIPNIFRRPIVHVNAVPFGVCHTWGNSPIVVTKHHIDISDGHELTLSEIFERGAAYFSYSSDYESNGISVIENTPEEILDAVIELDDRLKGTWQELEEDKSLQEQFWDIFFTNKLNSYEASENQVLFLRLLQDPAEIKSRYSAKFLRSNKGWLNLTNKLSSNETAENSEEHLEILQTFRNKVLIDG